MYPGAHAAATPDKVAYVMGRSGETVTYRQLDDRSNRLAQLLYDRGLRPGDVVAVLMENNSRYLEVAWAAQRSGLYYTCVNSRLTAAEVAYIVEDCQARAVVTSSAMADVVRPLTGLTVRLPVRLVVGGGIETWEGYEEAVAAHPAEPLAHQVEGSDLLYSSGTTGRPKGVRPPLEGKPIGTPSGVTWLGQNLYGFDADMVYLSPAPLYHAAPLRFTMAVQRVGGTAVVMEQFDPLDFLRLVERHEVTHTQVVPTMFVRMLKLAEHQRTGHRLDSLGMVIHGAAPCPVPVKERMIEWWGPILQEYYAGTEGNGYCNITSAEWSAHKGSVGQALVGTLHILDDDGAELGPGQAGNVWFEGGPTFEYHNDPATTRKAHNDKGWSSLGDVGYLDGEGYLYLTDRRADMIISGGVNVFPQEAENVLTMHPAVLDVAVFGVPDDDLGEVVKAVVQPAEPATAGPDLERELMAFCREQLASYKCPRSVDFEAELPRHPTGKLYKRLLKDRYWAGHPTRIV